MDEHNGVTLDEVAAARQPRITPGLRQNVLSPLETLAQSISTMAPSTSPTLTIPLVFALAGEGTWLAYVLALGGIALVALVVAAFARGSASPGSLYSYTRNSLPPVFGAMAAWALLFAYIATAASVLGGFLSYAYVLLGRFGAHVPPVLLGAVAAAAALWLSVRDIELSTRAMLWIEASSVCLIGTVVALILARHGLHADVPQLRLQGVEAGKVRLGVMLALFSFVGFESATTLGLEARNPLKTIPRAVLQSAALAGCFFLVCAYGEVLGFRGARAGLGESLAPMRLLSARAGVPLLGPVIDVEVLVSMFAATLSCVIAAARVLMLMAENGLVHARLGETKWETPAVASAVAAAVAFVAVEGLAMRGASGADIYGWMGTLAVYGFLTAYGLVAIALPVHLHRQGGLGVGGFVLSMAATLATLAFLVGTVYPVPQAPYRLLPYLYGMYLAGGMAWYGVSARRRTDV